MGRNNDDVLYNSTSSHDYVLSFDSTITTNLVNNSAAKLEALKRNDNINHVQTKETVLAISSLNEGMPTQKISQTPTKFEWFYRSLSNTKIHFKLHLIFLRDPLFLVGWGGGLY